MEPNSKAPRAKRRLQSVIWQTLNRGTARFYRTLQQSFWGRFMTHYRSPYGRPTDFSGGTPASPARQRVIDAVDTCGLLRGTSALGRGFMDCPTACYGLFGLLYGLVGVLLYVLGPRLSEGFERNMGALILAILAAVLGLPMLISTSSLAESLGRSTIARRLLVGFLGVPSDRLADMGHRVPIARGVLPFAVAALAAIGVSALNLVISPWIVPLCALLLVLLGMVFTYPEIGVVLISLTLPAIWLDQSSLGMVVVLILLTWCSYGLKLLTRHRTMRFGALDRVMLILMLLIFAMGFTGYGLSPESMWQSVFLTICASGYFLVVNLASSRANVRRCLTGVGASVVVVTVLAYLRRVPVENLLWLEGSRGGNAIIDGSYNAMEKLSQLWLDHSELYLVLVFAWLYAYLVHTKRLFRKSVAVLFILLDLFLILLTNSVSALLCVLAVTVLFLLMLGHTWLSAGLLALPAAVCGACWVQYLYPVSEGILTLLSRSRLYKSQLAESLWRMILDHPMGIGVGSSAFNAVYPAYAAPDLGAVTDCGSLFFEILLSYGWAGLMVFSAVLLLFLRKSFTAMHHTVTRRDRAMILGGVSSIVGLAIFGSVRSFITSPRVFFTLVLVLALCSAYENVIFEESAIETARWQGTNRAEDRFYRGGQVQ